MSTLPESSDLHPSAAELQGFIAGKLSEANSVAIERHLLKCADCNEQLSSGEDEDGFVQMIRDAQPDVPAGSASSSHAHTMVYASGEFAGESRPPEDTPIAITEIDGYEVLEELGRGGMGVVYRALHRELKREVALKVILSGAHSGREQRHRFQQEAETIARLQHSGIVQIYEVGEHDGHPYLALELIEGQTLSDLTQSEPQPCRWSATMALQLARTVHFAHLRSIIHRDLKPGNVLLVRPRRDGEDTAHLTWAPPVSDSSHTAPLAVPVAKITDFGLAKQLDSEQQLTQTGFAVGTPAYMAPEQATGNVQRVGPTVDVYALGAILYEFLTGRPPFAGDDPMQMVMALLDEEPLPPRKLRRDVPRDLETIVLKCLAKEPANRYASANDLAVDLELYLQGEPIHARPLPWTGKLLRWARRQPVLASTYLFCFLFYAIHLFARFVLQLPWHQRYWLTVSILFAAWAGMTTGLQWLWDRGKFEILGRVAVVAFSTIAITTCFTLEAGPRSAPVASFIIGIPVAALLLPRPWMIWLVTALGMACYCWLQIHAVLWRPENAASPEHVAAFLACLIVMGACQHLLLRRWVRRESVGQLQSPKRD